MKVIVISQHVPFCQHKNKPNKCGLLLQVLHVQKRPNFNYPFVKFHFGYSNIFEFYFDLCQNISFVSLNPFGIIYKTFLGLDT